MVKYICAFSQPSFLDAEKQRTHGSLGCYSISLWKWMFRPFWRLHRRQMPTVSFETPVQSCSSLGHTPAVISDVLRPGVLADAFGMQQGCKRGWVHWHTQIRLYDNIPFRNTSWQRELFSLGGNKVCSVLSCREVNVLKGLSLLLALWFVWKTNQAQSTRLVNELCGEIIEERMWKET